MTPFPGVNAEVLACDVVVVGGADAAEGGAAVLAVPAVALAAVTLGGAVASAAALLPATAAGIGASAPVRGAVDLLASTLTSLAMRSTPRSW